MKATFTVHISGGGEPPYQYETENFEILTEHIEQMERDSCEACGMPAETINAKLEQLHGELEKAYSEFVDVTRKLEGELKLTMPLWKFIYSDTMKKEVHRAVEDYRRKHHA